MPRRPIPFWTQSKEDRSQAVSAEKLVNWYLEPNRDNRAFPYVLYPTPGLVLRATVGGGPIRGIHKMGLDLYVVSGAKIYKVTSSFASTEIGDISGNGSVYMTNNGAHVLVVTNGQDAYAVNESGVTTIPEQSMVGAVYQDGYGVAGKRNSEQFYHSDLDDMTTWGATAFSSADAFADYLVGLASVQRRIWVFGETTIERWYNYGGSPFAFQREQGGVVEIGCRSGGSIAVAVNTVFWLGNDHRVYMSAGGSPKPVSTPAIVREIESDTSPEVAQAFVYTQEEHTFYVLLLSDSTLVFDATTGLWHHRKSRGLSKWRVNGYEWIWGRHLVGDYANGRIFELDTDTYTEPDADDAAEGVIREAISKPLSANGNRVAMDELLVQVESGVGLDGSGQGSDPELMVSYSNDAGHTWSNERTASLGKIGEYDKQVLLHRLGQFKERLIRVSVSDPVKAVIKGAYWDGEVLGG